MAKRKKQFMAGPRKSRRIQAKVGLSILHKFIAADTQQQKRTTGEDVESTPLGLLALPAELRVKIYELVLISDKPIDIDTNLKQPGLLLVSRQLRNEAHGIWYKRNKFLIEISACNDTLIHKFTKSRRIGLPGLVVTIDYGRNWENLRTWCEHLWHGLSTGALRHENDMHNVEAVVAAAHHMVSQHIREGSSWESCVEALENLKLLVQKLDPGW